MFFIRIMPVERNDFLSYNLKLGYTSTKRLSAGAEGEPPKQSVKTMELGSVPISMVKTEINMLKERIERFLTNDQMESSLT